MIGETTFEIAQIRIMKAVTIGDSFHRWPKRSLRNAVSPSDQVVTEIPHVVEVLSNGQGEIVFSDQAVGHRKYRGVRADDRDRRAREFRPAGGEAPGRIRSGTPTAAFSSCISCRWVRGECSDEIEALGWPVTALGTARRARTNLVVRLARSFRRNRSHVVHTHDHRACSYAGPLRATRVPLLVNTHGRRISRPGRLRWAWRG